MAILEVLGAAVGGGATGLLGTVFGRVAGYFERKEQHKRDVAKWGHDLKVRALDQKEALAARAHELNLHEINHKAKREEFEHDIVLHAQKGSYAGLNKSLDEHKVLMGNPRGSDKVIDRIRMVRPYLTFLLLVLTGLIYVFATEENRTVITAAVVYLTVTAVVWWFGDRAPSRLNTILTKVGYKNEQ